MSERPENVCSKRHARYHNYNISQINSFWNKFSTPIKLIAQLSFNGDRTYMMSKLLSKIILLSGIHLCYLPFCHMNVHSFFEWVSEWLLFNTKSAIFQLYHGENKSIFNERMILDLHAILSWIFIVLAHWNNSQRIDMSSHSHIILIPSQPVFALSP